MATDLAPEALDGPLRRTVRAVVECDDRLDAFLVRRSVREPGCCRRRCEQRENEAEREPDSLSTTDTVHVPL
jgi:hypothetical protein